MSIWLTEYSLSVLLGLVFWGIAALVPMRHAVLRPEFGWDAAGALVGASTSVVIGSAFVLLYGHLMDVDWVWGWTGYVEGVPVWALLVLNIVFVDFAAYWAHRALHSRWLWASHAWHHSPRVLYWLSGLRASPVHVAVLYAAAGVMFVVFPTPETGVVAMTSIVFDIVNQHFIHSNIRVPWARALERVLVTPRMHFVHHSSAVARANSNYGFFLSIWDRMFGTFTDPQTVPADDPLGLGHDASNPRMMLGLPARVRS
jgi:sterol desaturase/sphingolipid hydroxylase (fatty acid hydroxylase superfamily)